MESNGSGKTTLSGVLPWGLYGVMATGSKKDSIVCDDADEAFVELKFDTLCVRRRKPRGKSEVLSFLEGGETTWAEGDYDAIQAALVKRLGIPATMFFNSVWVDRENRVVQFLSAAPTKRLEILESILDDTLYKKARDVASRERLKIDTRERDLKHQLESLAEQVNTQKRRALQAQTSLQEVSVKSNAKKNQEANRAGVIRARLNELEAKRQTGMTRDEYVSLGRHVSALEQVYDSQLTAIGLLQSATRLGKLAEGDRCPTCKATITEETLHFAYQLQQEHRRLLSTMEEEHRITSAEVKAERAKFHSATSKTADDKGIVALMAQLRQELETLEDVEDDGTSAAITAFRQVIQDARNNIQRVEIRMQEVRKKLFTGGKLVASLKVCEEMFGPRGIRNMLLDDTRATLAHFTAIYAARLWGSRGTISFPPSENSFPIVLTNSRGKEHDLADYSKGEAWRASLSVLLGMRRTLAYLNKTELDVLILDDPFDAVDHAGASQIVAVANEIAADVGLVLVTTPREIQGMEEGSFIRIQKCKDISRIIT